MTALYYMIRPRTEFQQILGEVLLGEIYLRSAPQRMMETIRKTQKPCLTYRPLSSFVRSWRVSSKRRACLEKNCDIFVTSRRRSEPDANGHRRRLLPAQWLEAHARGPSRHYRRLRPEPGSNPRREEHCRNALRLQSAWPRGRGSGEHGDPAKVALEIRMAGDGVVTRRPHALRFRRQRREPHESHGGAHLRDPVQIGRAHV